MRSWTTRLQTGRSASSHSIRRLRQTRRLSPWDATDEDLQFMAALTERLGAPPVSNMMRYCGPEARHLDQLGESLGDWRRMLEVLARRYPDLPRSGQRASDGTTLDSAPERIVWETLVQLVPDELELCCHPLLEEGRYLRSDFGLCAPDDDTPLVCIEVMGMLGSDRICRADVEEAGLVQSAGPSAATRDLARHDGAPGLAGGNLRGSHRSGCCSAWSWQGGTSHIRQETIGARC